MSTHQVERLKLLREAEQTPLDWHPFAMRFPQLRGDEWKSFLESIKQHGRNSEPIIVRLVNGKKQGIDGRNRYFACAELGLPCAEKIIELADDDCIDYIFTRNVDRRHLDQETRATFAKDFHALGMSTRQIADKISASKSTVHRALKASGVPFGTPEMQIPKENAARIDGKDGKSYPATKPIVEALTSNDATVAESHQESTNQPIIPRLVDHLNNPVPDELTEVFTLGQEFLDIANVLRSIKRRLEAIHKTCIGDPVRLQSELIDLKNLKESVQFDAPYAVCPMCKGISAARAQNCQCLAKGWLLRVNYKNLPAEWRE